MALRLAPLIAPKELFSKLSGNGNIRVLDCTCHFPSPGSAPRSPRQEFLEQHIPGAQFFDIDGNSDRSSSYEHMLPSATQFQESVGQLGINNYTHVIVYDNNETFGVLSAPRVWWTFRVFGHNLVSVLNGGLPRWKSEGFSVTSQVATVPRETFRAKLDSSLVKYFEDMERNVCTKEFQVIDARSSARFHGKAPEPREGMKSGHMTGALSLPFPSLIHPEEKCLLDKEGLLKVFQDAQVDLSKPLVASCGSGVSACILAHAAYMCGKQDVAVYDGSWMEWYLRAKDEHKEELSTG